jgi:flagellar biosynthesis protein FlhA
MSPQAVEVTCAQIAQVLGKLTQEHHPPVLLVSPQIRPGLKQMTAANLPNLHILSYNEVTRDTKIEAVGIVTDATGEGV